MRIRLRSEFGDALAESSRHGLTRADGRERAIKLLDTYRAPEPFDVRAVDAWWTSNAFPDANSDNGNTG